MALVEKLTIDVDDYLQGELVSDTKFEFIHGETWEMPGVNRSHNIIAINLLGMLHAHLRNTSCRVYSGDMKVRVQADSDDCFFYPDLHVTCSHSDTAELYNTQPKLIVEVLSDATERYDRAEKISSLPQAGEPGRICVDRSGFATRGMLPPCRGIGFASLPTRRFC